MTVVRNILICTCVACVAILLVVGGSGLFAGILGVAFVALMLMYLVFGYQRGW